uniref:SEA domain-containing protein n=1 Tax=Gasterosteus aculeatus TaxID=69293 RepID=G3Q722_GASAC
AAPTTAAPVTTEAVTTRRLSFRSAGETFITDLLNTSSAAFQRRASLITSNLEPFYQRAFTSFRSLTVTSFSNGSIINNMDIGFASASVPNGTQIGNVLIQAASNITVFNVDLNSIFVDGSQVSSGVSHKISLITASFLVLSSWILSNQQ